MLKNISHLGLGCRLRGVKVNIIAFADDLFLLSTSRYGIQNMIDSISALISDLRLKINLGKSKYIVFNHKKNKTNTTASVTLNGRTLEKIKTLRYLGVDLTDNLDLKADIDRILKSFLGQFNSLYQKFNFLPLNILVYLFKTYCTSFFGINTWFEEKIKVNDLNKIEVAYHKAIKKIVNMRNWESNHTACEKAGLMLFKHLLSERLLNFYHGIYDTKCKFFLKIKYYFIFSSHLYFNVKKRFESLYTPYMT